MPGTAANGYPALTTAMTGAERIPVDTNLASGQYPQTVGLSPAQAKSGATSFQTLLTGFNVTIPNDTSALYVDAAGTLATGTIVMPAAPYQNQTVEITFRQTQTAVTLNANTGQSILNAITAGVALTTYEWVYNGTTWYRKR